MRNRSACLLLAGSILFVVPAIASKLGIFSNDQDIGVVKEKGRIRYDRKRDTYTVTGGGANIWGTKDAFHYLYDQVSGDVSLVSGVAWAGPGSEAHRKAGIMIRQTLDPDSEFVDVMVHGDGLTALQYRETAGGTVKEARSQVKSPAVIRIERQGDQITVSAGESVDDLKASGPLTLYFKDPVYIGFAVCAHNAESSETAIFKGPKIATGELKK